MSTPTLATEDRWEHARERATDQKVRLQVVEARRRYRTMSQSQDDTEYEISRQGDDWSCTCPGFQFTKVCKHVAAVELRAKREGWGTAPSDTEARDLAVKLMRGRR